MEGPLGQEGWFAEQKINKSLATIEYWTGRLDANN